MAKSKRQPKSAAVATLPAAAKPPSGRGVPKSSSGKHLVIVESPTKAKTINKYLGSDYIVMASVGHVRDLPSRSPKGVKQEVPGVDIARNFEPTYEILPAKKQTVSDLRKAAKGALDVWFATDLDREGEAIAWHLAQALGVDPRQAKRVIFNAITKTEIQHAFSNPRPIDQNRVDAQQARRILDRLVGYQVSPLLWKKVAGKLSAGRVQSVAVRVVVEREREIEAFLPEEYWKITGYFTVELKRAPDLSRELCDFLFKNCAPGAPGSVGQQQPDEEEPEKRTIRETNAWLSERKSIRAELVEVDGKQFDVKDRDRALEVSRALGLVIDNTKEWQDPKGRGPAKFLARYQGHLDKPPPFTIRSIETRRTTSRPAAPFITSTLQQTASTRLSFPLQRTMRIAQQLYEGVELKGQGQTGLITYMRTDSTHISGEALTMVRDYVAKRFEPRYLPEKPNFYTSSNKAAQEAHEAIRPTDVALTPESIKGSLSEEQYRLYKLIWERFVACQMTSAEWDSTTVMIESAKPQAAFKASGRTLVFDGFYKVTGVPQGDEAILPPLAEKQELAPLLIDPTQHFTSPPPRYTEASLQKKLEEEGIGRPSTYAAIIGTIQDRKYVQQLSQRDRRLMATDLGKVVTDKLVEAFPRLLDVGYTREMEAELDKIEDEHHDWVTMLKEFYGPFKEALVKAHAEMVHAKAEVEDAPFKRAKCGAKTVYRFGKNGRFLSCSRYPDCDYAAPIDIEGNPQSPELTDVACHLCGSAMTRRVGRFGPFLGCANYPTCKGILKLDPKKGHVVLPKPPPLLIELPCPKCASPLNMRSSKRGPWLSCSKFPKCRGRLAWSAVEPDKQAELEKMLHEHEKAHPVPPVKTTDGRPIPENYVPRIVGAAEAPVEEAAIDDAA